MDPEGVRREVSMSVVKFSNFRQNCVAEVFTLNYEAVRKYNKIFVPVSELGY